ncbi:MAG TPA: class I SAM-dependent methyltransferase [Acidimicrobiia bacterium]|nr:class I SAM-dependent methyltransferase [Acidimicrobiia bacterium]
MSRGTAAAYSATGSAWERGPARIYNRLAEIVVAALPVAVDGASALDLGAGTGAATRALLAAGADRVVAVDAATGMLAHDAGGRPPAVAGDALALPFATGAFDATVAAFSLNHLSDPAAGLCEAARVTRPGGAMAASAYADDDDHPVKQAVVAALTARGWTPDPWYRALQVDAAPKLATVAAARAAAEAAGLEAHVEHRRVPFPDLDATALIAWRLGLAQHAPFFDGLPTDADRAALVEDAAARLGASWPPLERSIIILRAVRA